jgi:hypothetical protein
MIALATTPFERWAIEHQYDITSAVLPTENRVYADRQTQAAYDAWKAGAASVARMNTESTLETPALRGKIRELARRA